MLRELKGVRFPLFLGVMLFALSGVLHPLFHMNSGCCDHPAGTNQAFAAPHSDSGQSENRDDNRKAPIHKDSHCPVCAGLFSSAEIPELPMLPVLPELPTVYRCILSTPHLPEFSVHRQVRAPPVLS